MAQESARPRLGRGLAALIGDAGEQRKAAASSAEAAAPGRGSRRVPIEFLKANPRNPRRTFTQGELDALTESIRERGVIQPIVVRAKRGSSNAFEIIAGERRWRAAQQAGLHDVPVVVVEATDRESLEYAIIENVQREDLNPVEEGLGYAALGEEFSYSHDEIAKVVGKSRPHVANTLRLLKLPESVKAMVRDGVLSAGHARLLVGHAQAEALADAFVARGFNVRQAEAHMRAVNERPSAGTKATKSAPLRKDADTLALEKRVSDVLGLKVSVSHQPSGSGMLEIHYRDLDQLEDVLKRLERS